jgi:hypothetical protein
MSQNARLVLWPTPIAPAASPAARDAFEQQVISELLMLRGPGSLHGTIATVQRAFLKSGLICIGPGNLSHYDALCG